MDATDPTRKDSPEDDVPSRFQVDFGGRTLLGIYRTERKLADGGMGSVYLAEDTNLGRKVVVKVPHARFLGEAGFRRRFRREVEELVRLEHPHVVRILAQGEEDGVPYFVLQYLGGGSLEDRLKAGPQDLATVLTWLRPIADTLDFVHARGVVHRDVKPANILFDEQGHVFLSDFGVVKALEAKEEADRTAAGTGIGSPQYMSPEQAIGRELSGASDQYALASTVYEALAGRPPHGTGTPVEILLRKEREAPPSLPAQVGAPPACDAALRRALARDPAQRFASCGELARAITPVLAPAPPSTPPRRGAALLVVAALLLLAALGGIATDWYGLAASSSSAAPAPGEDPTGDTIKLVDAGNAPHRALRMRYTAGQRDRLRIHREQSTTQTQKTSVDLPGKASSAWDVVVEVPSVDARGRASIEWLVQNQGPAGLEEGPAYMNQDAILGAFGGLRVNATVDDLGVVRDLRARPVEPSADERLARLEAMLPDFVEEIRYLAPPRLPVEPVGVGAVWDVSRTARLMGMRYHVTSTYELLEVDGDRVKIRSFFVVTAPPQGFRVPGMPEGMEAQVRSFHLTGESETRFDLDRAAAARHEGKGTLKFDFEVPVQGKPIPIGFETVQVERVIRE